MRRRCGSAWRRAAQALGSWQNGWSPCCGPVPAPTAATLVGWPPRRRHWLGHEYLPRAAPDPAVGPERYERALQEHLGMAADPVELAAWGWEELDRLEREMRREAAAGWPGVPLAEVLDRLDHDPGEPSAAGPAELLDWLGQLDQQVARRLSEEFDIPPQLRVLRHELAPP